MSAASFDPQVQQIATVYARGFLQAVTKELPDSGAIEAAVEELEVLAGAVFAKQPQLVERLSGTRISLVEKVGLLQRILGGRVSGVVLRFLGVVCQHGRFSLIESIAERTRVLFNQSSGVVPVTIISAVELPADVESRVTENLVRALGKKIELTKSVQPDLLGGLQVRVGDTVFDGSVQGRLERVRRTAFERAAERIRAEFDRFVSVQ
ncbi:MAG: ATP synthase F1 subunit delta [Planctomycetaceae bacterium]|jgi:F-type H+-transporting ATPase subunit delta|nr:ATP synthase F1 subunit delta [Planctomycetaceae bacterium]